MSPNMKRLLRDFRRSMRAADVRKPDHSLMRDVERVAIDAELLMVGATPELRAAVEDDIQAFSERLADHAQAHLRAYGTPAAAKNWHAVADKLALAPCVDAQQAAQRIRSMADRCYVRRAVVQLHASAFRAQPGEGLGGWIRSEMCRLSREMRGETVAGAQNAA